MHKEEEIKKRSMKERPLKNGGLKRPLAVEVKPVVVLVKGIIFCVLCWSQLSFTQRCVVLKWLYCLQSLLYVHNPNYELILSFIKCVLFMCFFFYGKHLFVGIASSGQDGSSVKTATTVFMLNDFKK